MTIADQPIDSPLSYTQANKAIVANAIHAFDAAFCATVAYRAAEQSIPLLTTHDCFACHPTNAGRLHQLLHHEFGQMYVQRQLARIHEEMQANSGIRLPAPPVYNSLDPMAIGSNPYLFS